MRLLRLFLAAALGTLSACGLVLGIDDIPPVPGLPDAGHLDTGRLADARKDQGADTATRDAGHDAGGGIAYALNRTMPDSQMPAFVCWI